MPKRIFNFADGSSVEWDSDTSRVYIVNAANLWVSFPVAQLDGLIAALVSARGAANE